MKKNDIPKARRSGLVIQELNDETLIYLLDTHRAVCLNQTSALVWQNCDGVKTVCEIGSVLAEKLKSPVNEDLIWLALDQLKKENLIENLAALETRFEGIPRREAVRKIGMTSLVALPVIAALTAPVAAQTGTCTPNTNCNAQTATRCQGCACNGNGNCFSNSCVGGICQ